MPDEPLEPCPFCGARAADHHEPDGMLRWVRCRGCGARGPSFCDYAEGPTAAARMARESWNRRSDRHGR